MPPTSERFFSFVFCEMGLAETFRERDVIRIRDNFGNHINVVRTANRSGGLVSNQQPQSDAANKNNLI